MDLAGPETGVPGLGNVSNGPSVSSAHASFLSRRNDLPHTLHRSMTITPEDITALAVLVTALSGLAWNLRRKR